MHVFVCTMRSYRVQTLGLGLLGLRGGALLDCCDNLSLSKLPLVGNLPGISR